MTMIAKTMCFRSMRFWVSISLSILLVILFGCVANAQSIVSTHPRVWFTPERIAKLKNYASRNTLRWQKLKANADAYLNSDPSSDPLLYLDGAKVCAIVYQVTGNPVYAQTAIRLATYYCIPANTLPNGFDYRTAFPDIIYALDWCYDQATPAQRTQMAGWLMDRANDCWPETNPNAINRWAVCDPGNNYFWGYMFTWPAAYACYGIDSRADLQIQLGLSKYRNLAQPYLKLYGTGGLFQEGTNYDSTMFLGSILDGVDTATGLDYINEPGFNFLNDSIYWRIYSTVPTLDYQYPQGSQSRVPTAPLFDYDRWRANVVDTTTNNSVVKAYGQFWVNHINPNISSILFPEEFLYYDEDATSSDYTVLPTSYYAQGIGFLTNRSDWSANATYWGIWAGPNFEAHQDMDVNGFMIWKGGWLAGNDSIWSNDGTLGATIYHNNLTFGGLGQTWQYPDSSYPDQGGRCLVHEITPEYTYFAGQGAQSYVQTHTNPIPPVTDYVRKLVWISPNDYFVYDRASLNDATQAKEWHLHSINPITVNGRGYLLNNGQYQLSGQSVLPSTGVTLANVPVIYGTTNPTSYRLDVVTKNNTATDWMMNVMQVQSLGAQPISAIPVVSSTGNMEGAACDSWVVMFGKSDRITTTVSYTVPSGRTYQNLVLDQVAGLRYNVVVNGISTVLTASSNGSLRFAAAGGSTVTINNADVIPFTISGRVASISSGVGIMNATVTAGGQTATTDISGLYTIDGLSKGVYNVSVSENGYVFTAPKSVTVGPNQTSINFMGDTSQEYYRINCGGDFYTDASGNSWIADKYYADGFAHTFSGVTVTNTSNPSIYPDVRASFTDFTYNIPAVQGSYVLKLHFAECDTQATTGYRVFDVIVNGNKVLSNFDIYQQAGGLGKSIVESIPVTPDTYGIHITFHTTVLAAMVSAIELVPSSIPAPVTYSISGVVNNGHGAGLPGATVTAGTCSTTTASDGSYMISGLSAGTYTVNARLSGYTSGSGATVTLSSNQAGVNLSLSPATYTVSGVVSSGGVGLAGATVTAGSNTATTSTNGSYTITGLAAGTYTLNAALSGYNAGAGIPVTLSSNQSGVNISLTPITSTYSISGTVTSGTGGLSGVTVSAGSSQATTSSTGTYTISNLNAGTYTVQASLTGYTLSAAQAVTLGPSSTGINFTATAVTPAPTSNALRINCGGSQYAGTTGQWLADNYYTSGASWTFTGVPITNFADADLVRSVHYSTTSFTYTLPAQAGSYSLNLYFVEGDTKIASGTLRLFNVDVNGNRVLTNFNVYQTAGSLGKVIKKSYTVVSTGSGVKVTFTNVACSAMVSAIELVPLQPTTSLKINCGGSQYASTSGSGTWLGDTDYSGGATWSFNGLAITGTTDPELYRDVRYGYTDFSYTLPATSGKYNLKLYFVEGDPRYTTGGRRFDVTVNGTKVLANLDVCGSAGGLGKAYISTIPVTVSGSGVNVLFHPLSSCASAMVSAIELTSAN